MPVTIADNQAGKNEVAAQKNWSVPVDASALCPVRDILDRIGDKWSLLCVLCLGSAEQLRFSELRRGIAGISQRMLTVTLRSLENDGFVHRTVHAEVPPRVEYRLTALGQSLLGVVTELRIWAKDHAPAIAEARQRMVASLVAPATRGLGA